MQETMGASGSVIASSGDLHMSSELQNMCHDKFVTVTSLAIMQRPLGSIGGFQRSGKLLIPGLGQHEYIIVDLASESKFILAEKLGKTKLRPAGIHVEILESDTGYCRHKCNLLDVRMQAAELVEILGRDRADYNLFTANCWKYAFHAARRILERCIVDAELTATAREFLEKEMQGLLDYEKNSPARYRPVGFAKHHPEYLKSYKSVIPISNQGTGY